MAQLLLSMAIRNKLKSLLDQILTVVNRLLTRAMLLSKLKAESILVSTGPRYYEIFVL